MSDPIKLQRQLLAMTDRARELEAILARLEARIVPLTVTDAAMVDRRLARAEAALDLLGVTLPAYGPIDRGLRDLEHAKLIGDTL